MCQALRIQCLLEVLFPLSILSSIMEFPEDLWKLSLTCRYPGISLTCCGRKIEFNPQLKFKYQYTYLSDALGWGTKWQPGIMDPLRENDHESRKWVQCLRENNMVMVWKLESAVVPVLVWNYTWHGLFSLTFYGYLFHSIMYYAIYMSLFLSRL